MVQTGDTIAAVVVAVAAVWVPAVAWQDNTPAAAAAAAEQAADHNTPAGIAPVVTDQD